ncbi:Fc receptor-like protein 1 isoform X3 [Ursus maritimus]|uniref:Fc receptor-like protein 1 isoform X3 n=1 Tax=Ursus maritimus TaxID=29073 RepID=A0A8M1G835_URSMA|nr:Fc receptor-like protein 1 isoform X3 [Ursus maritimus]XP_040491801.1 Fc receptor-like protein 1 isoform X3 [Ursus maritimus]
MLSQVLLLTAQPSRPKEGSSMTLICETQATSQKTDAQLEFCFFKDGRALGQGWSSSPKLLLPTVWREDSGSYWCEEKTTALRATRSPRIQIQVQDNDASVVPGRGCGLPPEGIPVWNVSLEVQPPGGQVQKGKKLVLICLATQGTGDITFSWYKGTLGLNLETKTQSSLAAKFEILAVTDSDTEKYYCTADNGYGPSISELVSVTVRSPVSRPVLTVGEPGAQVFPGDVVELRCEAQSGSAPILYRFYHEDVTLGSSSAPSGGGASFNLSLTAEHSGNYSCEADNGLGPQHSEAVPLTVTGTAQAIEPRWSMSLSSILGDLYRPHSISGAVLPTMEGLRVVLSWEVCLRGTDDMKAGVSLLPSSHIRQSHCPHPLAQEEQTLASSHTRDICSPKTSPPARRLTCRPLPSVPTEDRKELLTSGILEGLFGTLGPTIMALLFCCWLKKRIGRRPARDPSRSPPSPVPQVSNYVNSAAPLREPSVYENVNVVSSGNEVYSLVYHTQQERPAAVEPRRTQSTDQDAAAIYFRLKKASVTDVDYEDAM